jgi:hypothetical protein
MGAVAVGAAVGLPEVVRAVPAAAVADEAFTREIPAAPRPAFGGLAAAADDDPVRALFGPLREGSPVSTHWKIESVYALRAGAIPVVMSTTDGGRYALEIFRHSPDGPRPIAVAGSLALFLVNEGDGSMPTSELHGLGVLALGRELEARLAAGAPIPPGLVTHRRREAWEPGGDFGVPLG